MNIRPTYIAAIIIVFIIVAYYLWGSSASLIQIANFTESGTKFEQIVEPSLADTRIQTPNTAYQTFTKKERIFWATYELKLNPGKLLGQVTSNYSLTISDKIPGKIIETNADKYDMGTVVWNSIGEELLFVKTRIIRWWMIIFALIILIGSPILYYYSRKQKK